MSSDEEPYSLDFENDESFSGVIPTKKNPPKARVRGSIAPPLDALSSKSKSRSQPVNLDESQDRSKKKLETVHRHPPVQHDLDNSIDEMESFSAGASPLTFRNLLPSSSFSTSWFPSNFHFRNYFSPSTLWSQSRRSNIKCENNGRLGLSNQNEKLNAELLKRRSFAPVTNLSLSSVSVSKEQGPSNRKATTKDVPIEEIMLKLEKLEKAHSELENAIGLSEIEEEDSISSQRSQSAAISLPSNSVTISLSKSRSQPKHHTEDDTSNELSAEMDSIRKLLRMDGDTTKITGNINIDEILQSRPGTAEIRSDRSIDELLKEYDDLEKSFIANDKGAGDAPMASISDQLLKMSVKHSSVETGLGSSLVPQHTQVKLNTRVAPSSSTSSKKALKSSVEQDKLITHLPPKGPCMGNLQTEILTISRQKSMTVSEIGTYSEKAKSLSRSSSSDKTKSISLSDDVADSSLKMEGSIPPAPLPQDLLSVSGLRAQSEDVVKNFERSKENRKLVLAKVIPQDKDRLEKMKSEIDRQTSLTESYQKENVKLYSELKKSQEDSRTKEYELLDQVSRLKTEIATIKLNNLIPPKPDNSGQMIQKEELDRLKVELNVKSNQVDELHRQITRLKLEIPRTKSAATTVKGPKQNVAVLSQEKESEYQKNIRGLQKQIRTLQKIMYHKDPSAAMSSSMTTSTTLLKFGSKEGLESLNVDDGKDRNQQLQVLENRVAELENELQMADSASNEKLKEFQLKFSNLRSKYEDRIKDLEKKLDESENRTKPPELSLLEESTSKLGKSQAEITQLKLEISRYKRELEITAKSSVGNSSVQANAKQDAGTLSLAIKSFKAELSEKDKELIRTKKEAADLRKTNLHLKREREKYLTSTGMSTTLLNKSSSLNRAKSDLVPNSTLLKANSTVHPRRAGELTKKPNSAGSVPIVNSSTIQMLQETLESERTEFEKILIQKCRIIEEKENVITELKHKVQKAPIPTTRRDSGDDNTLLLEELRSRVSTQNKVIQTLKEHITSTSGSNSELASLRKEKGILEFRIRELNQQLTLAKDLSKPENEILSDLSEKVDSLNSRYHYREKQLDLLLKLAVKNGSYSSSLVNGLILESTSMEADMRTLSPTTSMHLLTDPTDI